MLNNHINMNNMINANVPNQIISNQKLKSRMLTLIEQNIQMANQIALNNNILKMIIENPQSVSESDNLNQVYNQNPGMNEQNSFNDNLCNVQFENTGSGKILNVVVSRNMKMADLLHVFFEKFKNSGFNFNKGRLEDYVFLYGGHIISLKEQQTLFNYGLVHPVNKIVFCSKNNAIGG